MSVYKINVRVDLTIWCVRLFDATPHAEGGLDIIRTYIHIYIHNIYTLI